MNLANAITIARILLIPVFLALLLSGLPEPYADLAAAAVFILAAVSDTLDGYVARSRKSVTALGQFLDPLADKLLVAAALVALVELGTLPSWIALVIISREFIVSGLRMVSIAEGTVITASNYGKTKTVFQVLAIIAFIIKDSDPIKRILGPQGTTLFASTSWLLMGIAIALTVVSMVDYFYHARDVITGPWEKTGGE